MEIIPCWNTVERLKVYNVILTSSIYSEDIYGLSIIFLIHSCLISSSALPLMYGSLVKHLRTKDLASLLILDQVVSL